MKIKSIILIVIAGLFLLAGCEQIQGPVLKTTIGTPVLVDPADGTNFIITEAVEKDTMTVFSWDPADYGFPAGVTYTLQITNTSSFTAANDIATTSKTKVGVLNSKMNSTLLIMGATPAVSTPVKFRVKAVVNSAVAAVYSDTATINVTPFEKIIIYPKLYVPGDHNGWSATNETTVLTSAKSDDKYEGYLYINVASGGMKFLKVPAWEQANTCGDANASGTSGTLVVGDWGNNILYTGGPGVFKINANLVDKTYSWLKTEWGLIGSATPNGWNSPDQNFIYDVATNKFTLTVNLVVGDIKFRANDDWAINLGDTGGDKKLEYGGDNIPVAVAGNYTITLDLSKTIYKYTIVKN
jgi:hypothetical protein